MKKQKENYILKLTQKQYDDIMECFGVMHERGGLVSLEIEYLLMILFNNDIDKANEILDKWEFEFNKLKKFLKIKKI